MALCLVAALGATARPGLAQLPEPIVTLLEPRPTRAARLLEPTATARWAKPAITLLPEPIPTARLLAMKTTGGGDGTCERAAAQAELAHQIPAGLLGAIARVESGRVVRGGRFEPWPWTVNSEGRGLFFASLTQAVTWVENARASGVTSIDTGCLQVNLRYHPDAFRSLNEAFDMDVNADYAARFLRQLVEGPAHGDWLVAAGLYHSSTPELAAGYRAKVVSELGGGRRAESGRATAYATLVSWTISHSRW